MWQRSYFYVKNVAEEGDWVNLPPYEAGTPATCVASLEEKNSPHISMVGRTPRKPSHRVAKAESNTTVFGVRWCG